MNCSVVFVVRVRICDPFVIWNLTVTEDHFSPEVWVRVCYSTCFHLHISGFDALGMTEASYF